MKKFLLLGFLSMFGASQAHAGFIQAVTGADMAGIEVTVTYEDLTTDTQIWTASPIDLPFFEEDGLALGDDWSLYESGDTLGELTDAGVLTGVWTFLRQSGYAQEISSIFIDTSATNVVFDTEFFDFSANGSGAGREFTYDDTNTYVDAVFSGLYMDELYTGLTISGSGLVDGFTFMIDTDLVEVSAPATASILMLSLLGLVMNARRKQA
jgi:hypothetical protein